MTRQQITLRMQIKNGADCVKRGNVMALAMAKAFEPRMLKKEPVK